MRVIVYLLFCPNGREDPVAEIMMEDPRAVPGVGDVIQFDDERDDAGGDLCGTVVSRVFRQLPYHTEIEVVAEPMN